MLILLDQENVSHHGLTGIESLNKQDKIVTFLGMQNKLSDKLTEALKQGQIEYEIQKGLVGTKNAADYQLISYLTYEILKKDYDEFLVLSRDSGFDISINYLKQEYPNVKIQRNSCILEYTMKNFMKDEFFLDEEESDKLYKSLLLSRFSTLKDFLKALESVKLQKVFLQVVPYFEYFQNYLKELKLDNSLDRNTYRDRINKQIIDCKNSSDTYRIMSYVLGIALNDNYIYLKSIRRCLRSSTSYDDFCHKIFSNSELLKINKLKRCDIPKKIKPFYDQFKESILKKG